MAKCRECSRDATEESGLCFPCAEELACMLHDLKSEFPEHAERIDPASAYHAQPARSDGGYESPEGEIVYDVQKGSK